MYEMLVMDLDVAYVDVMPIQSGLLRVAPIDLAISRGSKPIHKGTSSGRIYHIGSIAPVQCPK